MLAELKAQEERHDGSPLPEGKESLQSTVLRFLTLIYLESPVLYNSIEISNCFVLRVEIIFPVNDSDQRKIAYFLFVVS